MRTLDRDDSAVLPGTFRLAVSASSSDEPILQVIHGSSALIGRIEGCHCRFDDPGVGFRHVYLQGLFGRIYGVGLDTRSETLCNEMPWKSGWFDPGDVLRVGRYEIRLVDTIGLGSGADQLPAGFDPLDHYEGQLGPLPLVELELTSGTSKRTEWTVSRLITLVGNAPQCQVRLKDQSVSGYHCALVLLNDGLWVVDLAGKGGTRVRGKPIQSAMLNDGDKLRVGQFQIRAHHRGEFVSWSRSGQAEGEPAADEPSTIELQADPPQVKKRLDRSRDEAAAKPGAAGEEHAARGGERTNLRAHQEALAAQRRALDARAQQLDGREAKLIEAQQRLAVEWEHLHAERAALTALNEDLTRRREELATQTRSLAEEALSMTRQRKELSARAAELAELRKRLKAEWKKLEAVRSRAAAVRDRLAADRASVAQLKGELKRRQIESAPEDSTPPEGIDTLQSAETAARPHSSDALDSTRHNKVFRTERSGQTLVVMPLGDASDFFYGDVQTESNKVRRLLEGGAFRNVLVDMENIPLIAAVTVNVIVALSRIVSNRGGRAMLCNVNEKTRGVLQTMKLLELWPVFADRASALRELGEAEPSGSIAPSAPTGDLQSDRELEAASESSGVVQRPQAPESSGP